MALVVLAISLGTIYTLFSTGIGAAGRGEDVIVATALAQSKLDTLGVAEPLALGETTGRFDNGFRWRRAVRPYRGPLALAGYRAVAPYAVDVAVSWSEAGRTRTVTLSTVRLGRSGEGRTP